MEEVQRHISSELCKIVMSLKLRGNIYKSCVKNGLCYGAECWALQKKDERKLLATEMKMLRMICGKIIRDGKSSKTIHEMTVVEKIREFLQSSDCYGSGTLKGLMIKVL